MNILPIPSKFERLRGDFVLRQDAKYYCCEHLAEEVSRFVNIVKDCCGTELTTTQDITQAQVIFNHDDKHNDEGYSVMIAEGTVTVSCSTDKGCFYAIETLRQLWNMDFQQAEIRCYDCYIEDYPKFTYRGLQLDPCRHFIDIKRIFDVIDLMSRVKLNVLHLHLSDDQGFRVQIDKYPLINEISSYRNGSEVYVNGQRTVDEVKHGGFYTKEQIKQIVDYAHLHKVDVIPEIDVPGHFVSVLTAYPEYSCTGNVTEVRKKWGISKDILCAGNEQSYKFVQDILDEICDLFPSKYIHLGGDEAPKDRWQNCPKCRQKLSELKLANFDELQTYMVEQFRKYLESKGKTVICWNDGLTDSANKEIVSQSWKFFTRSKSIRQINNGRKTILSSYFNFYFDLPYGLVTMSNILHYKPYKGVKKSCRSNVLGVEGETWSEWIDCDDKFYFNLLPRLDALSQVAWGSNGKHVKSIIKNRFALYDKLGYICNKRAFRKYGLVGKKSVYDNFYKLNANIELEKYKRYQQQKTENK